MHFLSEGLSFRELTEIEDLFIYNIENSCHPVLSLRREGIRQDGLDEATMPSHHFFLTAPRGAQLRHLHVVGSYIGPCCLPSLATILGHTR